MRGRLGLRLRLGRLPPYPILREQRPRPCANVVVVVIQRDEQRIKRGCWPLLRPGIQGLEPHVDIRRVEVFRHPRGHDERLRRSGLALPV